MAGLKGCIDEKWVAPYCTEKSAEFAFTLVFLILYFLQLWLRFRKDCRIRAFRMVHVIYLLGSLSLLSNALHTFYGHVYYFDFETFFFNLYYLSLVFYASHRLARSMYPDQRKPVLIIQVLFGTFIVIYVALLVAGIIIEDHHCERNVYSDAEDWYVITRAIGLILSIAFLIVGMVNNHRQNQRLREVFNSARRVNNPLLKILFWICLNAISQLANLTESVVFRAYPSLDCKFDRQNPVINEVVTFIMLCITYYLSFAATLWALWQPCYEPPTEEPLNRPRDDSVNIEIVPFHLRQRKESSNSS